jgi:hypothetical protein
MGNMANVKLAYTNAEWAQREQYYIDQINKIDIPADPTTGDIKRITSEIDSILSEALLDFAYIRRNFEKYETLMKLATTEAFSTVKSSIPTTQKPTESEVKSHVVTYLKNNPLPGMKHSIYDLVMGYEERHIFMQEMIKILEGKKAALVTDNAMLKIESNISGGQP